MNPEQLTNPLVKAAIEAMNARDRERWFGLFADDVTFTDDGSEMAFVEWSDHDLFSESKAYLMSIDRVEDDGLTVYGMFHSDQWGEFDTFLKFEIQGDKITRLDVGQADEI